MLRTLSIFFLLFLSHAAYCQEKEKESPGYLELVQAESQLRALFRELYSENPADVEALLTEIQSLMPEALAMDGAMEYPWSRLDRIGVITSEDGLIRIFTWHVEDTPDRYRYFGYIQVAGRRDKFEVIPLIGNSLPQRGLYRVDQSTDNWYGKLYYRIVTQKANRKTYYTLMGMDFNNSRSNMKFVEMMVIQRTKPRFEKNSFSNGKEEVDRVVLEYSDQVAISVRYDSVLEMITYDHLVPLHPVYENNFEFYGPDGSFDGLRFMDGIWVLEEDIDARMPY